MSRKFHPVIKGMALASILAVGLAAPANLGHAKTKAAPAVLAISAKDKQQGAEAHPGLVAEFGGAMTGPYAAYVETIGKNIALRSGLSNARDDFTVTLLNSPVNNAFAIPGGYIYTTRQLVALMNNEAELGGVLGHEVFHVAARHSNSRQKAATKNSILGVLGTVLAGAVLGDSTLGRLGQKLASQGSQMLTMKYSRSQETDSDNAGIKYLKETGYDPRAMSTVLQSLANQNALEARLMGVNNQVPAWASSHPDPASRVRSALAQAGTNAAGNLNRDIFLSKINGILYGDDPKQGVVEGRKFTHPEFQLTFNAPDGYYMMNGTRAVTIGGQTGKAEFTGAAYNGDMEAYVRGAFTALGQGSQQTITPGAINKTTVNGIPAAYATARVQGQSSQLDVVIFAYEFTSTRALHFMTISPAGGSATFEPMFGSMRRITTAEAAAVKPRKVLVVNTKSGDTLQSLAARMAYSDAPMDRFLVLNGLTASSQIRVGQKVKLVTY